MPSTIYFAAAEAEHEMTLVVDESPEEIFDALTAAGGLPFRLARSGRTSQTVYVNPATIAYWTDRTKASARVASL